MGEHSHYTFIRTHEAKICWKWSVTAHLTPGIKPTHPALLGLLCFPHSHFLEFCRRELWIWYWECREMWQEKNTNTSLGHEQSEHMVLVLHAPYPQLNAFACRASTHLTAICPLVSLLNGVLKILTGYLRAEMKFCSDASLLKSTSRFSAWRRLSGASLLCSRIIES